MGKCIISLTLISVLMHNVEINGVQIAGLPDPIVKVELQNGKSVSYAGKIELSDKGRFYASYLGIRYAKAPVGNLRFKPPVFVEENELPDKFDALEEGPSCMVVDLFTGSGVIGSEDCLFLNIFKPAQQLPAPGANSSSLLPVMIWIHGGGFVMGSSSQFFYHPGYLMDRNIVVVTINYRLHAFGFLSNEDSDYPGNMGLLDQSAAIKWVKKNIEAFGGDPNKVTIFGESAGGASTHFQMLSPHNEGLLHGVISQSGAATVPWALQRRALHNTKALAERLECPVDKGMMKCLVEKPAKDLALAVASFYTMLIFPFVFVPRIDSEAKNPFLPDHPQTLMDEGRFNQVPWLTGITADEGAGFTLGFFLSDMVRQQTFEHWKGYAKTMLLGDAFEDDEAVLALIESHYFDKPMGSLESAFDLTRSISELWFAEGAQHSVDAVAKYVDTFAYVLNHATSHSIMKKFLENSGIKADPQRAKQNWGVAHGDDLIYLFKCAMAPQSNIEGDLVVRELFLDAFSNFATFGTPNGPDASLPIKWPKFSSGSTASNIFTFNTSPKLLPEFLPSKSADFLKNLKLKFGIRPRKIADGKNEL